MKRCWMWTMPLSKHLTGYCGKGLSHFWQRAPNAPAACRLPACLRGSGPIIKTRARRGMVFQSGAFAGLSAPMRLKDRRI